MTCQPSRRDGWLFCARRAQKKKQLISDELLPRREDPTRTDDPYVPNVVRYQLRYFSIAGKTGLLTLNRADRVSTLRRGNYANLLM